MGLARGGGVGTLLRNKRKTKPQLQGPPPAWSPPPGASTTVPAKQIPEELPPPHPHSAPCSAVFCILTPKRGKRPSYSISSALASLPSLALGRAAELSACHSCHSGRAIVLKETLLQRRRATLLIKETFLDHSSHFSACLLSLPSPRASGKLPGSPEASGFQLVTQAREEAGGRGGISWPCQGEGGRGIWESRRTAEGVCVSGKGG